MWHDLLLNLVSEAVGIVVTVFFVDRLLSWREHRRWKRVQALVWKSSWQPATAIAECWGRWLSIGQATSRHFNLSKHELEQLRELKLPVPDDDLTLRIQSAIGTPIGSRIVEFSDSCLVRDIEALRDNLVSFLAANPVPPRDAAWNELSMMARPVNRLLSLVGGFSSPVAVEPEFTFPVLRLSYDLDNLNLQEYQADVLSARLPVSRMLAESIEQTLLLRLYLRSKAATHWLETPVGERKF